MDVPLFTQELRVAKALQYGQKAAGVFIEMKTACVGCYLTRFCTLGEVARTYALPQAKLLARLEQAVRSDPSTLRSTNEIMV
jgi:hypothetical protein